MTVSLQHRKKSGLKPIMFVGTCSDAGKSVINTAFCRIFREDGYTPAPFKAQNMSLNSYSTPEGGEIGRAQAVQAEACGIPPHTDMNPVLLKPTNDKSSQVILNGRPVGNMSAREYFRSGNKDYLLQEALAAYRRLAGKYNPVVLEGAGSISELNLRERDITNMRMAREVGAATYLVADIDRGGVFASVYGSVMLLPEEERKLIKGIIVNKFRGDVSLFEEGRELIRKLTGIPVVGVLPYFTDIQIEEEDSVALEQKEMHALSGKINVAVVLLRRISNFTDFSVLEQDKRFHLYYTNNVEEIRKADIIVLPGSKNTIADLMNIRANGIAEAVVQAYKAGKKVVGICGGYQMMGLRVEDPDQVEGEIGMVPGLGLFPLVTVMEKEKTTCQSRFRYKGGEEWCEGYQIHMGRTEEIGKEGELKEGLSRSLNTLETGERDGFYLDERCWGSYIHGILDHAVVLNDLAAGLTQQRCEHFDYMSFKQEQYDRLARHVRDAMDMDYIYSTLR
ncbi:cobyric acid synthase [uncultured Odoribacter sp.]|uniref:cobyric acid synthase n=1 Tax=uncultured Odoribacter sp. TaxID=876416 RepID=UPI0026220D00|nr:cobyric acid synthase [uncultured Odoribacter sp.]